MLALILIEAEASRFITEVIDMEKELTSLEHREKSHVRILMYIPNYNQKWLNLIQILEKINSITNSDAIRLDDLSFDFLLLQKLS